MKIGDTVICVDDSQQQPHLQPVVKGIKYVVNNYIQCNKCGIEYISVGFFHTKQPNECQATCKCGKQIFYKTTNEIYHKTSRFRVIEPLYRVVEIAKEVKELELTQN